MKQCKTKWIVIGIVLVTILVARPSEGMSVSLSMDGHWQAIIGITEGGLPQLHISKATSVRQDLRIGIREINNLLSKDWVNYSFESVRWSPHSNLLAVEVTNADVDVSYVLLVDCDNGLVPILLAPFALRDPMWSKVDKHLLYCLPGDQEEPPVASYLCLFDLEQGKLAYLKADKERFTDPGYVGAMEWTSGGVEIIRATGRKETITGAEIFGCQVSEMLVPIALPYEIELLAKESLGVNTPITLTKVHGSDCSYFEKTRFYLHQEALILFGWVNILPSRLLREGVWCGSVSLPGHRGKLNGFKQWAGYEIVAKIDKGNLTPVSIKNIYNDRLTSIEKQERTLDVTTLLNGKRFTSKGRCSLMLDTGGTQGENRGTVLAKYTYQKGKVFSFPLPNLAPDDKLLFWDTKGSCMLVHIYLTGGVRYCEIYAF